MTIEVSPVPLEEILPLRELYRHELSGDGIGVKANSRSLR